MSNVIIYSESQMKYKHKHFIKDLGENEHKKIMIKNAIVIAENLSSKAMIIISKSLNTAKLTAALRPNLPVYCFTYSDTLSKKANILFGLKTFVINETNNKEEMAKALDILKNQNFLEL
jgi:pyruvate kinase